MRRNILAWFSENMILTAVVLAISAATISSVLYLMNNTVFTSAFQGKPYQFAIFFAPILAFFFILISLSLSQENLSSAAIASLTIIPSITVAIIFTLALAIIQPSHISMLALCLFSQIIALCLYFFISQKFNKHRFLTNYSSSEHAHAYSTNRNFWLCTLFYHLSFGVSLLALELFSSESSVGEYASLITIAIGYYAIMSPLYTYLSSQASIHIETNLSALEPILKMIKNIHIVFTSGLTLVILFFAQPLLNTLNLASNANLLITSTLLFFMCAISRPYIRIVLHSRYEKIGMKLQLIQFSTTLLLLIITIPKLGILGALLSDTLPVILTNLMAYYICTQHLGLYQKPVNS